MGIGREGGGYAVDEGLAPAKVLVTRSEREAGERGGRRTLVIWLVRASISRSSWERSEKPGRTCLA